MSGYSLIFGRSVFYLLSMLNRVVAIGVLYDLVEVFNDQVYDDTSLVLVVLELRHQFFEHTNSALMVDYLVEMRNELIEHDDGILHFESVHNLFHQMSRLVVLNMN